jgi:hypothetical protein
MTVKALILVAVGAVTGAITLGYLAIRVIQWRRDRAWLKAYREAWASDWSEDILGDSGEYSPMCRWCNVR